MVKQKDQIYATYFSRLINVRIYLVAYILDDILNHFSVQKYILSLGIRDALVTAL